MATQNEDDIQIAASKDSGYLQAMKNEHSPPNEEPITVFQGISLLILDSSLPSLVKVLYDLSIHAIEIYWFLGLYYITLEIFSDELSIVFKASESFSMSSPLLMSVLVISFKWIYRYNNYLSHLFFFI